MLNKKTIGLGAFIATAGLLLTGCGNDSEVLVKIGKEEITTEALINEIDRNGSTFLFENLINNKLVLDTKKFTQDQLDERIKSLKEEKSASSVGDLAKAANMTEENYLENLKIQLIYENLLIEKAGITEDEINSVLTTQQPNIVFNKMVFEKEKDAEKMVKKLLAGESFENAAAKTKEDYYLAYKWNENSNGNVMLTDKERQALEEIKTNDYSEILEVNDTFVLLEKKEVTEDLNVMNTRYSVVSQLAAEKGFDYLTIIEELRKDAKITYENEKIKTILNTEEE